MNNCPHCQVSLIGAPITEDKQEFFNSLNTWRSDPGWVTHYRREIGVEVRGVHDGVLYWKCPDCQGTWQRWPEGSSLFNIAKGYL